MDKIENIERTEMPRAERYVRLRLQRSFCKFPSAALTTDMGTHASKTFSASYHGDNSNCYGKLTAFEILHNSEYMNA